MFLKANIILNLYFTSMYMRTYVRSLLYQDSAAATRLPQTSPSSRPSTATSYLTTSPRPLHTTTAPTTHTNTTHVYKTSSSPTQQGGGAGVGGNKHSSSLLIPKTGILRSKSATNLLTRNHTYRENTPKKEGGHDSDRDIKVPHVYLALLLLYNIHVHTSVECTNNFVLYVYMSTICYI